MKADRVRVLKPGFTLIDIDAGAKQTPLPVGSVHFIEHAEGRCPSAYYVLQGTRIGSIQRYWEDQQREGVIRLIVVAEAGDPTLDGIPLPIRSRTQLTEWQMDHTVCGYLVGGKFLCARCTLVRNLTHPDAIAVYPRNVLPYSQGCSQCGLLIFDIWRTKKGGPLCLFS